ncbi:MAG: hypothetical protein M3042_06725 [Actinomycetota bacterium]|nr:hypothetical protein [Actinomycetota bacterium]
MSDLLLRDCSTCGGPRAFEVPTCIDEHGVDCPELACVECGDAVLIGSFRIEVAGHVVGTAVPSAA